MELKDLLDIVIIPITISLIALIWPGIQDWYRRRNFKRLILRELDELSPYPEDATLSGWWEHCQKRFIHREILEDPVSNRDFILSLDPDLSYYLTQLWYSLRERNWVQWKFALQRLNEKYVQGTEFSEHRHEWEKLYKAYEQKSPNAEGRNE